MSVNQIAASAEAHRTKRDSLLDFASDANVPANHAEKLANTKTTSNGALNPLEANTRSATIEPEETIPCHADPLLLTRMAMIAADWTARITRVTGPSHLNRPSATPTAAVTRKSDRRRN